MTTIDERAAGSDRSTIALADPEHGVLDDLVDVGRYPIHQPDSAQFRELMAMSRDALAKEGTVSLPGFLRPEAVSSIASQLDQAVAHIPIRDFSGTVYHRCDLEKNLPADDPRRAPLRWKAGHVTRDMIPPYSGAHRVYVSPLMKRFIATIVGRDRIFEYADPMAGLVATVLPPGGQYPWHYDTNEFVVTIMIQAPAAGGEFCYVKDLRTPGDENMEGLKSVLDGSGLSAARTSTFQPGDLQLFLGRYSLHQVTPVEGRLSRHVLVLSYADRPGVIGPLDRTRSVYGRVTEAHLVAAEAASAGHDGLIL